MSISNPLWDWVESISPFALKNKFFLQNHKIVIALPSCIISRHWETTFGWFYYPIPQLAIIKLKISRSLRIFIFEIYGRLSLSPQRKWWKIIIQGIDFYSQLWLGHISHDQERYFQRSSGLLHQQTMQSTLAFLKTHSISNFVQF